MDRTMDGGIDCSGTEPPTSQSSSGDSLDVATEIRKLTEVIERLGQFQMESMKRETEMINALVDVLEVVVSGDKP